MKEGVEEIWIKEEIREKEEWVKYMRKGNNMDGEKLLKELAISVNEFV